MENTSCEGKCPFVKIGFCANVEECPNYIESWWLEGQTGATKLVKDCVPKRLMHQMNELKIRFEGVQAAGEQARNECHQMNAHFTTLVDGANRLIAEQEQKNLIENVIRNIPAIENKQE